MRKLGFLRKYKFLHKYFKKSMCFSFLFNSPTSSSWERENSLKKQKQKKPLFFCRLVESRRTYSPLQL